MLRWLLKKLFKKDRPWFSYIPPVIGILLCYMTLFQHRTGDAISTNVSLAVALIGISVGITLNLRRFVMTLQRPYHSMNLHIALGSIFSTVVLFAAVYCTIYILLPNSFVGFAGDTPLDECVNALYFSSITFTTVGFGDIYPVAYIAKIVVTIEAMSFFIFFVVLLGNHRTFIKPKDTQIAAELDAPNAAEQDTQSAVEKDAQSAARQDGENAVGS